VSRLGQHSIQNAVARVSPSGLVVEKKKKNKALRMWSGSIKIVSNEVQHPALDLWDKVPPEEIFRSRCEGDDNEKASRHFGCGTHLGGGDSGQLRR